MERKPVLRFTLTVKSETRKRVVDKPDTFIVDLKSDSEFTLGMHFAKAKLNIKAEDSILQNLFPKKSEFVIEIYSRFVSEPEPEEETEQTPLDEEQAEENSPKEALSDAN